MIRFKKFLNEEKENKKYHKFFSSSKAKHPDDEKEENKKYHKFFSSSKAKHPDDINEEEEKEFEHHPDALVHSKILSKHKDLHNAIQNYTGPFHVQLNRNLFIGKEHERKLIQKTDDNVSKSLRKTKALRDHVVYSGMRSPENLEINSLTGMIHMQHPAYLSASHNFEKAIGFGKDMTQDGKDSEHIYFHPSNLPRDESKNPVKYSKEKHGPLGMPSRPDWTSRSAVSYKGNVDGKSGNWYGYKHVLATHVPEGSHGCHLSHISEFPEEDEYLIHKNAQIHVHPEPTIDHEKGIVIWHGKLVHDGIKETSYHPDNAIK